MPREAFLGALGSQLAVWGVDVPANRQEQMFLFYQHMLRVNRQMNLTGVTEPEAAAMRHFADSLNPVVLAALAQGGDIVDVGSGAGFPGIPLAIACPQGRFTLLDSLDKRVRFLQEAIGELGLKNAVAVCMRAEDYGRGEGREAFDYAVSRAVAPMNLLAELTLGLVRTGGAAMCYKGAAGPKEAQGAQVAIDKMGGGTARALPYELGGQPGMHIIRVEKARATPAQYPRRAGIPAKRPLA